MKSLRNLGIVIGFLALGACSGYSGQSSSRAASSSGAADTADRKVDCSTVRCAACPEGQTPALKPPDCCRCVPIK
jgi:hypothetical protein